MSRVGDVCEGRSNRMVGVNDMINEAIATQDVSRVEEHLETWHDFQQAFVNQLYALNLPDDVSSARGQEEEASNSLQFAAESGGDPDAILENLISAQTELSSASAEWSALGISCTL
ncbi:MAG: hypothetical protein ICV70_01055 [Jiangellaceae bacterium]|nr:hypothetical protein [Jiangellaceae bacterium]